MFVSISEDYALLNTRDYSFYYGYEEKDCKGSWMFVARNSDGVELIRYSSEELGCYGGENTEVVLLKGVGKFTDVMLDACM